MAKTLRCHKGKLALLWLPLITLNRNVRPVHANDIEGVFFAAAT
jgi:hypothetical protein